MSEVRYRTIPYLGQEERPPGVLRAQLLGGQHDAPAVGQAPVAEVHEHLVAVRGADAAAQPERLAVLRWFLVFGVWVWAWVCGRWVWGEWCESIHPFQQRRNHSLVRSG